VGKEALSINLYHGVAIVSCASGCATNATVT
jgi:hypothetical protein